jgi:NAD(P)-dependent dehydrogenase (short-subunit alcohol dehydrogenase family)
VDEGNLLPARGRHKLRWRWDSSEGWPHSLFVCSSALLTAKQIIGANGEPHSLDVWNFVLGVNLTGTFNLTRIVCKYLVRVLPEGPDEERGVVVMVASSAAVRL